MDLTQKPYPIRLISVRYYPKFNASIQLFPYTTQGDPEPVRDHRLLGLGERFSSRSIRTTTDQTAEKNTAAPERRDKLTCFNDLIPNLRLARPNAPKAPQEFLLGIPRRCLFDMGISGNPHRRHSNRSTVPHMLRIVSVA